MAKPKDKDDEQLAARSAAKKVLREAQTEEQKCSNMLAGIRRTARARLWRAVRCVACTASTAVQVDLLDSSRHNHHYISTTFKLSYWLPFFATATESDVWIKGSVVDASRSETDMVWAVFFFYPRVCDEAKIAMHVCVWRIVLVCAEAEMHARVCSDDSVGGS